LGRSKGVKGRACGPLRAAPETLDPPFHSKSDQEGDVSENGIKHAKPVTAAIVLWNTVYLERATSALSAKVGAGKFRPLRPLPPA